MFREGNVFGTHEEDHRYTVSGQVRDEAGKVLKGKVLTLQHKGGEQKTVKTDASGRYEVLFHLHNENLGEEIVVSFGDIKKTIKINFDPDDKFSMRGGTVNFGAVGKEENSVWIYFVVGAVVVFIGVYINKSKKKGAKKRSIAKKSKVKRKT